MQHETAVLSQIAIRMPMRSTADPEQLGEVPTIIA